MLKEHYNNKLFSDLLFDLIYTSGGSTGQLGGPSIRLDMSSFGHSKELVDNTYRVTKKLFKTTEIINSYKYHEVSGCLATNLLIWIYKWTSKEDFIYYQYKELLVGPKQHLLFEDKHEDIELFKLAINFLRLGNLTHFNGMLPTCLKHLKCPKELLLCENVLPALTNIGQRVVCLEAYEKFLQSARIYESNNKEKIIANVSTRTKE